MKYKFKIPFSMVVALFFELAISSSYASSTIRIAYPSFGPLAYSENGKTQGRCVNLIDKILGSEFDLEKKYLPWKRSLDQGRKGRIDAIACLVKSADREKDFIFSNPVLYYDLMLISSSQNRKKIRSLKDLEDASVASVLGDGLITLLEKKNVFRISNIKSLLEFVAQERADYTLLPNIVYQHFLSKLKPKYQKKLQIKKEFKIFLNYPGYIAVSKKSSLKGKIKLINKLITNSGPITKI